MTKEDKELVLRDISARLLYGVIVQSKRYDKYADVWDREPRDFKIIGVRGFTLITDKNRTEHTYAKGYVSTPITKPIDDGQTISLPYLRSMSSMTEEEKDELLAIVGKESDIVCEQLKNNDCGIKEGKYHFNSVLELEFLLSHHFDFRGLIPKGLALEAPKGMYKFE